MAASTLAFWKIFLLCSVFSLLADRAYCFGAGSIPAYAYLHDRAFRHGDLANVLTAIAKTPHHHTGGGGGLFDLFATLTTKGLGAVLQGNAAAKFSKADVRRVYFGNWLRDYSQAIDVGGLSVLTFETLLIIIQALGFMSFGYATREFHITPERLGVYLPVEHIDNPKRYAEAEGDARKFHSQLRPPVDPKELEIDKKNGMKKYMATEGHSWDTSTAHIRRTLKECIALGRLVYLPNAPKQRHAHHHQYHQTRPRRDSITSISSAEAGSSRSGDGSENDDDESDEDEDCEEMWEALRLLGTALHTLEDLLAHSNWCELALRKMGHKEVFCHVGDNVRIKTPNGRAPPLVTGTFGSADFMHSILGEASDQLSQASVVDLTVHMEEAESTSSFSTLRTLLASLPAVLNPSKKVEDTEQLVERAKSHHFSERSRERDETTKVEVQDSTEDDGGEDDSNIDIEDSEGDISENEVKKRIDKGKGKEGPAHYAPSAEVQAFLFDVLTWRDGIARGVAAGIEIIPGLGDLLEQLMDLLNQCVYTLLAPALIPIIKEVTLALHEQSQAVIDIGTQYEVFDDPNASDPTHSILAKDHVDLILNEPAGRVAQVVVEHTVELVVHAWYDRRDDPDKVIDKILETFHHPYFASRHSLIQSVMFEAMQAWLNEYKREEREVILSSLTKEAVREGRNKRIGSLANSTQDTFSTLSGETDGYGSASALEEGGGGVLRSDNDPEHDALQADLDSLAVDLSDRDRVLPAVHGSSSKAERQRRRLDSDASDRGIHVSTGRQDLHKASRRRSSVKSKPTLLHRKSTQESSAAESYASGSSSLNSLSTESSAPRRKHGSGFTKFWTELVGWTAHDKSKSESENRSQISEDGASTNAEDVELKSNGTRVE